MPPTRRYAYLHGFASGPMSRKGQHLARAFRDLGQRLETPDLNAPSFARLTCTGALGAMDALDAATPDGPPWRLVGSSLGGYLAALWASRHPDRVDRLVLLCPGFDLTRRWPALLGAEAIARWRAHGALTFPDGAGVDTPVHWGFIEDALTHPRIPDVSCPTVIIHGTRDEVVPVEGSRRYAEARPHVSLVEVDDDHALAASLEPITERVIATFAPGP